MKKWGLLGLLLLSGSISVARAGDDSERTREDVNREVVLTYSKVYLEQKEFDRAEQVILDYISSENDRDGRLLFQLGEVQLEQRKFSEACASFQSSVGALKGPDQVYAQYGLARCQLRAGRMDETKKILNRIAKDASEITDSVDQALAGLKSGRIRSGDALPPFLTRMKRSAFRFAGALGGGYDTNVLLVEDDVARGASSDDIASYFLNPSALLGFQTRIFGQSLEARLFNSYTHYLNQTVNSFNSLYSRADLAFGSGPVRWTLYGDVFYLNRSPFGLYSWESGLMWSLLRDDQSSKSTLLEIPLQYQKFILPEGTDSTNDRTGADLKVRFTRRWYRGDGQSLSLGATLDAQLSTGANYKLAGFTLPASGVVSLPVFRSLGLLNTFGLELRGQVFPYSDTARRDLLGRFSAGFMRQIGSRWSLLLDYSGQKNISTVAAARYSKNVVLLQLSAQFF
jgi:tetratricopeptide (TPR) repeat protein